MNKWLNKDSLSIIGWLFLLLITVFSAVFFLDFMFMLVWELDSTPSMMFKAEEFCGGKVSWSNPAWFSCGSEIDFMGENYYSIGSAPFYEIQKYSVRFPNG